MKYSPNKLIGYVTLSSLIRGSGVWGGGEGIGEECLGGGYGVISRDGGHFMKKLETEVGW